MDYTNPEAINIWGQPTLPSVGSQADIGDPEDERPSGSLGIVPDDEVELHSMVDSLVTDPPTKEEKWWKYLDSLTQAPAPLRAVSGVLLPWRQPDVTQLDVRHSRVAGQTAMTEVQPGGRRRRHIDAIATASVASSIELPDPDLSFAWKERLKNNTRMSQKAAARRLGPIGPPRLRPHPDQGPSEGSYGSRDTDLLGINTTFVAGSSGASQNHDLTSRHSPFDVPELEIDLEPPDVQNKDPEGEEDDGSDSTSRAESRSAVGRTTAPADSDPLESAAGTASGHEVAPWGPTRWSHTSRSFAQVAAASSTTKTSREDKGKGVESVDDRSENMPRSSLAPLASGPTWSRVASGEARGSGRRVVLRRARRMSG